MSIAISILIQAMIIALAIVGGIFIAFSDFIMRSLARTSGSGGIEAMQHINREVFRWVFMVLFIGLAPFSLGISIYGVMVMGGEVGNSLALAGVVYLVGCFGVTVCFNVPLNNRLEKLNVADASTEVFWRQTYLPRWTMWNSVRSVACIISALLLLNIVSKLP